MLRDKNFLPLAISKPQLALNILMLSNIIHRINLLYYVQVTIQYHYIILNRFEYGIEAFAGLLLMILGTLFLWANL